MSKTLPIFTTDDGRSKYLDAYDAVLALWDVPHQPLDVQTRYGPTHINTCGPIDAPPLILLPAAGLSSTAWFLNVAELSRTYRVYAVDVIGDAGRSVAYQVMEDRAEYSEWLQDVLDRLDIDCCHVVGHSYGGWLAMNMALAHPDRVNRLVLLAPAASIYPFGTLAKLSLRLAELKVRPRASFTLKMQAGKGMVFDPVFVHHMQMVSEYCMPATMFPTVFTDDELRRIVQPTLLMVGSSEKIYNASDAVERARKLIPNLNAEIIPDVGHTLNMERPADIVQRILNFVDDKTPQKKLTRKQRDGQSIDRTGKQTVTESP